MGRGGGLGGGLVLIGNLRWWKERVKESCYRGNMRYGKLAASG